MFLKSLTVQGFKSFADRTTLEFTPGISVIVGPNGSGKSNLSDAVAWVLGEQGPKTLRGGRMEDVIFAGTPKRPASGRAEASLTIDNSAGVLPIEFSEVTITRRIFRGGESEYELNGVPCRLLDVQELLSDSGIGRELHTIVGQGQLDQVLQARPEERRAYIEEAAGILKYRRRKERALRKLERTDADIERLADVMSELRRQIRPLEQQAEMAKRAAEIQQDLSDVTLRLWLHEYGGISSEGDREAEARLSTEAAALSAQVRDAAAWVESLETEGSRAFEAAEEALGAEYRLSSARERLAALSRLAEERARHLEELSSRAPEAVAPSPEAIADAESELAAVAADRAAAEAAARRAEQEWIEVASSHEVAVRAHEEVVHMHGERAALRAALQAAEEERRRLQERRAFLARRRDARRGDLEDVAGELQSLDDRETELTAELERARAEHRERAAAAAAAVERLRALERTVDTLETRRGVISDSTSRSLRGLLEGVPGILGTLGSMVRAKPGYERAVRAALEPVADAIVAAGDADAVRAIDRLRSSGGRARFIVPHAGAGLPVPTVASVVERAPDAVRTMLAEIALVDSLAAAVETVRSGRARVAVTPDGDRADERLIAGGDPRAIARDLDQELSHIEEELSSAAHDLERARTAAERATDAAAAADRVVHDLTERTNGLDAELTGAAERMADLEREDHAAMREDAMMAGRISEVEERIALEQDRLGAVEARLARAVADERPSIDSAALAAVERRASERSLNLGSLVERERAASHRVEELRLRARRVEEEIASWERSREARAAGARRARTVASASRAAADRAEIWVEEIRRERFAREERRARAATDLASARRARRELEERAENVREMVHRSDLARAERSHRLAALVERLRAEHQLSPEEAAASARPPETREEADDLGRRAATLRRKLDLIGRVNPIAMEQFQGMIDRHAFLSEQVSDLRKSRRDLVAVVDEVDRKIEELFTAAFADVSREFEEVFARLFPGGEGRLTLTDRDDILSAGVDVEARPGGKRVKRISLLSGGERALTAIALLASIFRARPSPFYLLDEVEAALDDVNLHRFLALVREFKVASQILVVTHQKRTMEVADVLYGISMGADGVTKVISQRIDDSVDDAMNRV